MKYNVLYATCKSDLVEFVNEALKEGWKLQGGVSVAATYDQRNGGDEIFLQAVVMTNKQAAKAKKCWWLLGLCDR